MVPDENHPSTIAASYFPQIVFDLAPRQRMPVPLRSENARLQERHSRKPLRFSEDLASRDYPISEKASSTVRHSDGKYLLLE